MENIYVDNLSERLKFNYYSVVNKCERMGKYFLAICELEEYYHKLWKMELN